MTRFAPASLTASAALLLALAVSGRAHAAECASNADCDKGFQCQDVGGVDCTAPACAPGASCPEPEPCAPSAQMECVPAECASDAECGDGMVCHEYTQGCATVACTCPSDQPDCACDVPACDPRTLSYCTPKYALPCTVAADCGSNFSCVELESCGCSGSSGSGGGATPAADEAKPLPPDGDAAPPAGDPLPPECSCQPTGQSACVPQEIECASDAACPAGWTCQEQDGGTSSGCAGEGCDAAPAPEPLPTRRLCFPKYYGGTDQGVDLGGTPTSGGDDKGSTNGSGTQNPEAAGSNSDADSNDSAACQMGHAPASRSAFGILAVLGALFGFKRRRAQLRA
jgi:hypothetical protein